MLEDKMSNSEDMSDFDQLEQYDRNYNAAMRKMKADNAEKEAAITGWEADMSAGKPSLETVIGSPPLSQQEMEERADKIAKEQLRENDMLERQGLVEPQRDEQAMSFEEKLQAKLGEEKIEAAREEARQEQQRKLGKDREQSY